MAAYHYSLAAKMTMDAELLDLKEREWALIQSEHAVVLGPLPEGTSVYVLLKVKTRKPNAYKSNRFQYPGHVTGSAGRHYRIEFDSQDHQKSFGGRTFERRQLRPCFTAEQFSAYEEWRKKVYQQAREDAKANEKIMQGCVDST